MKTAEQATCDVTINVNEEWLENNFLCMKGCPVHTEAGRYVNLIAQKKYQEAYKVARKPNPLASICGRICAAPCESVCRRGKLDQPIAIRALKRFVTEKFGVESMLDVIKMRDILEHSIIPKNKSVAVIGSGPAGLACAHDLALKGYNVTIFEKHEVPGGMLRLGIPEYRLPRELIRLEINAILQLGVELKLGKELGVDFTIKDLRNNGYEAIFIGIGAHKSRILNLPGQESDGILYAIDYLLNVNLGYKIEIGKKIVVIGGGNVAFDVARTAVRKEKPEAVTSSDIIAALDVARSAVRFGVNNVDMVVMESENEMLADIEEIEQAKQEKIIIHNSYGPKRIISENGKVIGIEIIRVKSLFDNSGNFNPTYIEGTEKIINADSIIIAIGQSSELNFIEPSDNIEITLRGTIKINPDTLATSAEGIYCGGDAAFGPRIAISAIADGKKAANSIDTYLSDAEQEKKKIEITCHNTYTFKPILGYTKIQRQPIPNLEINRRVGISQVELGYDEYQAQLEAGRCLKCWDNTIFEGNESEGTECILCGGCSDVCPENCIEIHPSNTLVSGSKNPKNSFKLSIENNGRYGIVLIKNEEVCIRCGLCAKRCPVGTITMQGFQYSYS